MLIISDLQRLMATYDEDMLERIPPTLLPGEREHIVIF
jgi:hypothetical protein